MRTSRLNTTLAVISLIAGTGLLMGGPLQPAAGPVGSTMKTLTDVEPRIAINAANTPGSATAVYKITQPGSYYLTENLVGASGKNGVEITSGGVTLDLNGFQVKGVAGSLAGVRTSGLGVNDVTILNGTISGWGQSGVETVVAETLRTTVRGVNACNNGQSGLRVYRYSHLTNCITDGNTARGIDAYSFTTVTGCDASGNGDAGIDAAQACLVEGCKATGNVGYGIRAGSGSTVRECVSASNLTGVTVSERCLVTGNAFTGNVGPANNGSGVLVSSSDNRIEGNNCAGNGVGVNVLAGGNFIVRNTCAANMTNWNIVAANVYGPIVDRSAAAGGAVVGNSAASTLGTTDANANFTY